MNPTVDGGMVGARTRPYLPVKISKAVPHLLSADRIGQHKILKRPVHLLPLSARDPADLALAAPLHRTRAEQRPDTAALYLLYSKVDPTATPQWPKTDRRAHSLHET
jgi:hypothetical protein